MVVVVVVGVVRRLGIGPSQTGLNPCHPACMAMLLLSSSPPSSCAPSLLRSPPYRTHLDIPYPPNSPRHVGDILTSLPSQQPHCSHRRVQPPPPPPPPIFDVARRSYPPPPHQATRISGGLHSEDAAELAIALLQP